MSEYFCKYIENKYYPLHPSEIKFKTYFTNTIKSTFTKRGYKQTEEDDWRIYWCEKQFLTETLDKIRLFPQKRVNHFRNWFEICRKDLLSKNIKRFRKQLEKEGKTEEAGEYNFLPLTYNLPTQYPIFLEQFKRTSKDRALWIMKPIGRSQGKGIFIFNKISEVGQWSEISNQAEPYIVQRYIQNPLLIGNKKFDLRIYVLVTSHNPLTVYLYRSGFARFTHSRYDHSDFDNLERHLTNVAIQKYTAGYDEQRGGKQMIRELRLYLLSKFNPQKVQNCFFLIQELVIKTLLATSKVMISDKRCFELYGFDVMIDNDLKPWLIEVNGSPSMTANTETDAKLKCGLVDDTLSVINIESLLTGEELQVGGFDLVYKNGKRVKIANQDASKVGCLNNRQQNMRKMAKTTALRLAESKRQQQSKSVKQKGKSQTASNPVKANMSYSYKRTVNPVRNRPVEPNLRLPKLINNSNKNIEVLKKPEDVVFRKTFSRESGK